MRFASVNAPAAASVEGRLSIRRAGAALSAVEPSCHCAGSSGTPRRGSVSAAKPPALGCGPVRVTLRPPRRNRAARLHCRGARRSPNVASAAMGPAQLRDVAAIALAHGEAPAGLEAVGHARQFGGPRATVRGKGAPRRQRRRAAAAAQAMRSPADQCWCFCITASSVSWFGFWSARRATPSAPRRACPLFHNASPRCAAISGSDRVLYAMFSRPQRLVSCCPCR